MASNSRREAAHIIMRWLMTGEYPSRMLDKASDRAFVQDLVYTVVRRKRALREILSKFVKRWPRGELEALLYVGAAQILYMDSVPDFAAVNETVEAAKPCREKSISRVVNGVLRNMIRSRESLVQELDAMPLAIRESYPDELVARWVKRFGQEGAERLAAWHNSPAETFLAFRDGRFEKLERAKKVDEVPGYGEGGFIVQDPATALSIDLLDIHAGETILDACAAPGGKTIQCAWRGAKVFACEVNPARRKRLAENISRAASGLGVEILSAIPDGGAFAKVLVDAPCSNSGVLRRKPDAKWNWSEKKLKSLASLQAEILDKCAPLVMPGGALVYSTCSNEPEENQLQVQAFLSRHGEFSLAEECESIPFQSGTDGAYAARLVKRQPPAINLTSNATT